MYFLGCLCCMILVLQILSVSQLSPLHPNRNRDCMRNTAEPLHPGTVQGNLSTMWCADSYNNSSCGGKKRFDSWCLSQLDGSYLSSDSGLCFKKKQPQNNKKLETHGEMEENQNDLLCYPPLATKEHLLSTAS